VSDPGARGGRWQGGPEGPPDDVPDPQKQKILRWVAVAVAAPLITLIVLIMYFVIQTELAHDDAVCPFEQVSSRALDDGTVIHEEMRRCQEDVEEHRWLMSRAGAEARELGRRRLPTHRFEERVYHWSADIGERGPHVHVENDGVEAADYYEQPPER